MENFQQIKEAIPANLLAYRMAVGEHRTQQHYETLALMQKAKDVLADNLRQLIKHNDAMPVYKGHDMYKFDKFNKIKVEDMFDATYLGFSKRGYVLLENGGNRTLTEFEYLYSTDLIQFVNQLVTIFS